MISRRDFLKLTGMSAAAAAAGFTSGNHSLPGDNYFIAQGFLPADEPILTGLFDILGKNIPAESCIQITTEGFDASLFRRMLKGYAGQGSGRTTLTVKRTAGNIQPDILISTAHKVIHEPDSDYALRLYRIREQIRGTRADLFFSLEYSERPWLSNLIGGSSRAVVLRNEKGIVDKINIDRDYTGITVDGAAGKTLINIEGGKVRVSNSCCRNKICVHTGWIASPGNIIACAPNKVIIRIVSA